MKAQLYILLIFLFTITLTSFAQDEFKSWNEQENSTSKEKISTAEEKSSTVNAKNKLDKAICAEGCRKKNSNIYWIVGTLFVTILAGIFIKFKLTRKTRGFFLIASVVILGFYRGSCPCPVSSLQETLLLPFSSMIHFSKTFWFIGLIPITYFFGKVWCGWVCHLGALQELIFSNRFNFYSSEKAQKVFRYFRQFILIILIIQLLITKEVIWNKYDPFKTAYNLIATNTLSWILLGILLISSVLIYRPFCKSICPVGLVLGWISKIPGAAIIKFDKSCVHCKSCDKSCKINAITYNNKSASIEHQECIACGECIDSCKHSSLHIQNNTSY